MSLWLIHWPCWHACTTSPAFQAWALQKRRNETELAFVCSNLLATKETEESRKMIVGHNAVAFIHKHEHTHTYTNENKHTHTCIHTHSHNWVPCGPGFVCGTALLFIRQHAAINTSGDVSASAARSGHRPRDLFRHCTQTVQAWRCLTLLGRWMREGCGVALHSLCIFVALVDKE